MIFRQNCRVPRDVALAQWLYLQFYEVVNFNTLKLKAQADKAMLGVPAQGTVMTNVEYSNNKLENINN